MAYDRERRIGRISVDPFLWRRVVQFRRRRRAVPAATSWWDVAGLTASDYVGAWSALGATDLADSYTDYTGNGNDLFSVTPPTWSETGWNFTGSQWLLTTPQVNPITIIVRFSDQAQFNYGYLMGMIGAGYRCAVRPNDDASGRMYMWGGFSYLNVPGVVTSGTMALAQGRCFYNGVEDGYIDDTITPNANYVPIGCARSATGFTSYYSGKIQAAAMLNIEASPAQIAALHASMMAL